jgi:hypothetical protein
MDVWMEWIRQWMPLIHWRGTDGLLVACCALSRHSMMPLLYWAAPSALPNGVALSVWVVYQSLFPFAEGGPGCEGRGGPN